MLFGTYFEKVPPLRPEGAAGGGARGIVSKHFENRPLKIKINISHLILIPEYILNIGLKTNPQLKLKNIVIKYF